MKCKSNKFIYDKNNFEINSFGKRKTIKGIVIGTIFGIVITGGIGVAAVTLTAEQVKYTPSNEKFNVINIKEAVDEIYKIAEYEIPEDTYFYDSSTTGEEIVRYKKVDGKYYLCDKNGKVTDETEQDVTNITLTEYTSSDSLNLTSGKTAFSKGSLILGNSDSSMATDYLAIYECTRTAILKSGTYKWYGYSKGYDSLTQRFIIRNEETGTNIVSVGVDWGTGGSQYTGEFVLEKDTEITMTGKEFSNNLGRTMVAGYAIRISD